MAGKPSLIDPALQQLNVAYSASTSEIKDDIAALTGCWRTGHGALPKAEAGFLLWYHALSAGRHEELAGAGLIASCLTHLSPTTQTTEQGVAAGILRALASNPDQQEALARAKPGGGAESALKQLVGAALGGPGSVQAAAAGVLAVLTRSPEIKAVLLRGADLAQLRWGAMGAVLVGVGRDSAAVTGLAQFLAATLHQREELAAVAMAADLPEALLTALRQHKSETTCGALAAALASLARADPGGEVVRHLLALPGAVRVLVDLLGPPPSAVITWEQQQQQERAVTEAAVAAAAAAAAGAQGVAGEGGGRGSRGGTQGGGDVTARRAASLHTRGKSGKVPPAGGAGTSPPSEAGPLTARPESPPVGPGGSQQQQPPRSPSLCPNGLLRAPTGGAGALDGGSKGGAPSQKIQSSGTIKTLPSLWHPQPHATTPSTAAAGGGWFGAEGPLSVNSTRLKWESPVSLTTRAAVADCLYSLVQTPEGCHRVSLRLTASRLVPLMLAATGEGGAAGGGSSSPKKKGKKGMALSPDQDALLTAATGCLKLLTAGHAADAYRVAAAGGLGLLVQLAAEAKRTLLRRNAQAVLGCVSHVAEVEEFVAAAAVPEELVPQVKVRLTGAELEVLLVEWGSEAGASAAASGLQRLSPLLAQCHP